MGTRCHFGGVSEDHYRSAILQVVTDGWPAAVTSTIFQLMCAAEETRFRIESRITQNSMGIPATLAPVLGTVGALLPPALRRGASRSTVRNSPTTRLLAILL